VTDQVSDQIRLTSLSHGAGCACKLPLATLERIALALLEREVIDANEVKLLMEGKPLPEKPRTPPTPPPQAATSADPKVVRPELRPAPGFTRGENPAKA